MSKKGYQKKQASMDRLKQMLHHKPDYVVTNYRGVSVSEFQDIRQKLGPHVQYRVFKNTLIKRVFTELDCPFSDEFFKGPTALMIASKESNKATKHLVAFFKLKQAQQKSASLIKGGVVAGELYDHLAIEAYSRLPSYEELLQQLMATMQAPTARLALTLNESTTSLVRALNAFKESKAACDAL